MSSRIPNLDPVEVLRLCRLLDHWSELEPERCKEGGEEASSMKRLYVNFPGHRFRIDYSDLRMPPLHGGMLLAVEIMAIEAQGWGWTKDYMLRNDATVLWRSLGHDGTVFNKPYRCAAHGTPECSTLLEVNLLNAYLQALVGRGREEEV